MISALGLALILALAAAATAAPAASVARADPCAVLAKQGAQSQGFTVSPPSAVLRCLDSFRFTPARDLKALDTVVKSLQAFYFNAYLAQDQPDPRLPGRYDAIRALTSLKYRTFNTSRQFHELIYKFLLKLNDAHTGYSSACYLGTVYTLAMPLIGAVENGTKFRIRVAPVALTDDSIRAQAMLPPFSFNMPLYQGSRVLSIDGVRATKALLRFAAHNGGARDPGARLNAAFAQLEFMSDGVYNPRGVLFPYNGAFSQRTLPPKADFVIMQLRRPYSKKIETVRVPWLAWTESTFTDRSTFWNTKCALALGFVPVPYTPFASTASQQQIPEASLRPHAHRKHLQHRTVPEGVPKGPSDGRSHAGLSPNDQFRAQRPKTGKALRRLRRHDWDWRVRSAARPRPLVTASSGAAVVGGDSPVLAGSTTLSAPADYFKVFLLKDAMTIVVPLYDFEADFFTFQSSLDAVAQLAKRHGKRVIFDVRGNPGGYVENCFFLILALLGSAQVSVADWTPPLQLRQGNRIVDRMVQFGAGPYDPTKYADMAQTHLFAANTKHFFYPIQREKWASGETLGNYSSFFKLSLEYVSYKDAAPMLGNLPYLFVTDGRCYSSCALLLNTASSVYNKKVITVGGRPRLPMAISNTCGGLSIADVVAELIDIMPTGTAKDPLAPQPFQEQNALGIGWASARIPANHSVPCEFVFYPGHAHVPYTISNVLNPVSLWNDAAKFF